MLPPPDEWNAARQHSLDHPTHILGPYEDDAGVTRMSCDGDGDPNEPSNCRFDTGCENNQRDTTPFCGWCDAQDDADHDSDCPSNPEREDYE